MEIYVLKEGLRYGPYSINELEQEVDAGVFKPEHFASHDNCHSWNRISKLTELAPLSFSVRIDESPNLLVIRYRGRISRSDVERCPEEVRRALPKLSQGFRLLVDLSQLEEMDISCASVIAEIMDLCNGSGVATVVRVIPQSKRDIGLQIMSLFHYRNDVEIGTCTSMDEALTILFPSEYEKRAKETNTPVAK